MAYESTDVRPGGVLRRVGGALFAPWRALWFTAHSIWGWGSRRIDRRGQAASSRLLSFVVPLRAATHRRGSPLSAPLPKGGGSLSTVAVARGSNGEVSGKFVRAVTRTESAVLSCPRIPGWFASGGGVSTGSGDTAQVAALFSSPVACAGVQGRTPVKQESVAWTNAGRWSVGHLLALHTRRFVRHCALGCSGAGATENRDRVGRSQGRTAAHRPSVGQ